MDELHFDELLEMEISKIRTSRSKPVKRMWREIEAIRDRKRLEKELLDKTRIDVLGDHILQPFTNQI